MKIAVVCANGKAGQLIVKEAVNRGFDVCKRRKQDRCSERCRKGFV